MKLGYQLVVVLAGLVCLGAGGAAYLEARTTQGPTVVDNAEDLTAAIEAGEGTTVIRIKPGSYPLLVIAASKKPRKLVLESADATQPALLAGIKFAKASDVAIRNITVHRKAGPAATDYLIEIANSSNIHLEALNVRGTGGAERGRQYGAMIRGGRDIRITESRFSDSRYGIGMLNTTNVTISFNEFRNLQTDGIRGGGVSNLIVSGNILGDFSPRTGEHPDGIQLWSTNQKAAAKNITIRDNLVVRNRGGIIQGIFVRDTKNMLPFEDVAITGNLMIGTMYNGISITGVRRGTVTDNQVYAYPDMKSWVSVGGAKETTANNNKAMLFLSRDDSVNMKSSNKTITPLRSGSLAPVAAWRAQKPAFVGKSMPYLDELSRP